MEEEDRLRNSSPWDKKMFNCCRSRDNGAKEWKNVRVIIVREGSRRLFCGKFHLRIDLWTDVCENEKRQGLWNRTWRKVRWRWIESRSLSTVGRVFQRNKKTARLSCGSSCYRVSTASLAGFEKHTLRFYDQLWRACEKTWHLTKSGWSGVETKSVASLLSVSQGSG